jgi:PAS domain S-box-containing protein
MNEKISFLNLFFQPGKDLIPLLLTEKLSEHFGSLIFIYDAESRSIRYINQNFADYTGKNYDELRECVNVFQAFVHAGDLSDFEQLLQVHPEGKKKSVDRVRLQDHKGNLRFYTVHASPLQKNEEGQTTLILFTAQDISQALKTKEEIDTTRELLDETEELLQFGSWAWDLNTQSVTWTSGLYSLLGYFPEEIEGRIDYDFYLSHVLEESYQSFQDTIQQSIRNKTDFDLEYFIRTKSGVIKTVSTKGKIVKNEVGDVVKVLCINRDITSLRSFEKDQERNIRELNRSNKELEEFAYIASHDLQEPLRKVSMFTERLKAKFVNNLDKEGELFIDRILNSAANMRILIDNLLEFSRANRRTHTYDQVNLRTLLEEVISELELKIEETKSNITLSGTFPTLEAVSSEMKQLFGNILSNAIKFRKPSAIADIRVQSTKLSKAEKLTFNFPQNVVFWRIDIKDNGIGFEEEYSEKIFQIFQRLNGKAEYPGSGIGLAICKKIAEKHNGVIFAKSEIDQGSVFSVILPEKQF